MRSKILFSVLAMALAFFVAGAAQAALPTGTCGRATTVDLLAGQTTKAGTVTVSNDAVNLYVTYNTAGTGWYLSATHLHVAGSLAEIPQTKSGNPKIGTFSYKRDYAPPVTEDTYIIPLAQYGWEADRTTPLVVAAHAVVVKLDGFGVTTATETGWAAGLSFPGGSWAMYFNYQLQSCKTNLSLVMYRTQTQGGWGTIAKGGNPGTFRDANFAGAFPSGLEIGSNNGTARFTSSFSLACFLPQGGPPDVLSPNHYLNPGLNIDGMCSVDPNSQNAPALTTAAVLGGQVTALTLNVMFDEYCRTSGKCVFQGKDGIGSNPLRNLVVKDGLLCAGMTVGQVLEQANLILGGQKNYGGQPLMAPSQINECASKINESFVDGLGDSGYLRLP